MKIGTFLVNGERRIGVIDDQQSARLVEGDPNDVVLLIAEGDVCVDELELGKPGRLDELTFLPPLTPTRNIFCVGKNYRQHAREFNQSGIDATSVTRDVDIDDFPAIFTKAPTTLIGHEGDIESHEGITSQLDYEAELAVVIGKSGRAIARDRAYEYVFGYSIINDVTARDLQKAHRQWFMGKSLDTFCPMGPWITTADELDPTNLTIECRVNDEVRQKASTTDLIFDIPTLIATISSGITLVPGDIIATGTPAGVGIGFDPPRFLKKGDVIEISIAGLGTLRNRVE